MKNLKTILSALLISLGVNASSDTLSPTSESCHTLTQEVGPELKQFGLNMVNDSNLSLDKRYITLKQIDEFGISLPLETKMEIYFSIIGDETFNADFRLKAIEEWSKVWKDFLNGEFHQEILAICELTPDSFSRTQHAFNFMGNILKNIKNYYHGILSNLSALSITDRLESIEIARKLGEEFDIENFPTDIAMQYFAILKNPDATKIQKDTAENQLKQLNENYDTGELKIEISHDED